MTERIDLHEKDKKNTLLNTFGKFGTI